jgi:hypothetical protein
MNANDTAGFGHNFPRSLITDGEYALMGLNAFFPDIILEPIRQPLGNKNELLLSSTFWVPEGQSPVIYI